MQVDYDSGLKIAGLAISPWPRVGLERWFEGAQYVSLTGWDLPSGAGIPPLWQIDSPSDTSVQALARTARFDQLANNELRDYYFLLRSTKLPDRSWAKRCLMNDLSLSKFENKAWFREQFGKQLPFASFRIVDRLEATQSAYEKLCTLSPELVLQHERLSGGQGTHVVRNFQQYLKACSNLAKPTGRVVVSAHLNGAKERSVQCCATRYGIFRSPLQKQIVAEPSLTCVDQPGTNLFAGGEIGTGEVDTQLDAAIDRCVQTVGQQMWAAGFRGVFGLDFLLLHDQLYILEVNARLTGMTPLLTMMYQSGSIPFYLLHVLGLGGFDYTIQQASTVTSAVGGLLILRHRQLKPERLVKTLASGIYHLDKGKLEFQRSDLRFRDHDGTEAILVQANLAPGGHATPGVRLLSVMTRQPILDSHDQLTPRSHHLVAELYKQVQMEAT